MKLPYNWLADYTPVSVPVSEFARRMTMSGSKVESWDSPADSIENVVCARILSLEKHPDSNHLWICSVDIGSAAPSQIVTGAQNLKCGDLVPAALPGARLPKGIKIEPTVMRGVQSDGMLCSMGELGLDRHDCPDTVEDGILVLSAEYNARVGQDIREVLALNDVTVDFEITPNRPDCLSVIGLAREASVTFDAPLTLPAPPARESAGELHSRLSVSIENPDVCLRYCAAMVTDIHIAPSPKYIRDRLRAAGVRPINNIVDITNFVMLEYGQPMHAFDYSCVSGGKIAVRTAKKGETTQTLDGQQRAFPENAILITDASKIIAAAGIMGGANSEITENTREIVFESACFSAPVIRNSSRRMGMRTEASSRFEKGLDTECAIPALLRALELVEKLGVGRVVSGIIDEYPNKKQPRHIKLEPERIRAFIGADIPRESMEKSLTALGFVLRGDDIEVPSWRDDVEGFADIAEETARFFGYDRIPSSLLSGATTMGGFTAKQRFDRALSEACRAVGFNEACTLSFMSPKAFDKLLLPENDPRRAAVRIINPLGEDQSLMRTSPLPAMLEVIAGNLNHRVPSARLFEPSTVYFPTVENGKVCSDKLAHERKILTLACYGAGDFFAFKGTVEAILRACLIDGAQVVPEKNEPSYHPGRCGAVMCGDLRLGVIGQIHPSAAENFGISAEVLCAELEIAKMFSLAAANRTYAPLPKYPAVSRDLALVCAEELYSLDLERVILRAAGSALHHLSLFDVYRGAQLGEGKKSLAYTLALRAPDHTLTDAEADAVLSGVLKALEAELGVTIRA